MAYEDVLYEAQGGIARITINRAEVRNAVRPRTYEELTDAMARLMADQSFTAVEYAGVTHDCGDKIGLLRANVALALKRPDLGDAARQAIAGLL